MDKKFHLQQNGLVVSLYKFDHTVGPGTPAGYDALTEDEALAVEQWVRESKLGRRIAWDMWRLRNQEAMTLFVLKWGY